MNIANLSATIEAAPHTSIQPRPEDARTIGEPLTALLADFFALYMKTKNFHWHMSGPSFRDNHLLLDDQAAEIIAATDQLAERARKRGSPTLHSIGQIARLQRIADNDADVVTPLAMLTELREDNRELAQSLRDMHGLCDEDGDLATASLLENLIDEAEGRTWFLFEITRRR